MTLVEVLKQKPHAAAVLDELAIDYACGGATSVKQAATNAGLTASELLAMVERRTPSGAQDWYQAPLGSLTNYLTEDHQRVLGNLKRVRVSIDAAIVRYGELPALRRVRELEHALSETLASHAASEERDLFPIVESLEAAAASPENRTPAPRISARVLRECVEHENLRDRVHAMRDLTRDVMVHHDVEALSLHLRTFQRHLHEHMHLENNVLYPRAIEIENGLRHAHDGDT